MQSKPLAVIRQAFVPFMFFLGGARKIEKFDVNVAVHAWVKNFSPDLSTGGVS